MNALTQTSLAVTPEMQVLLRCARVPLREADAAVIRRVLTETFDWSAFASKVTEHGLASITGRALAESAPDLVPPELLDAFELRASGIARRNTSLFAELTRLTHALNRNGIEIIPFKGPVTAIQAYGDLAAREFRDLDFLVRDFDLSNALSTLQQLGYDRQPGLTSTQLSAIHRIQGQEVMIHNGLGVVIEPHTRLTSAKLALDIDYPGLWSRSRPASVNGERMIALAPEDHFILLAIHGGKELWWRMNWACDLAAFISAHPQLDWPAIVERARQQGCRRMVLLAASLAAAYFRAAIPDAVLEAARCDHGLRDMVHRITNRWFTGEADGPPSPRLISRDLLRLHDGILRRLRYATRTLLMPAPAHIGWVALPRHLGFAYVPLKLVHDTMLLPAWRSYRYVVDHTARWKHALMHSDVALAVLPASPQTKVVLEARAEAKRALAQNSNDVGAWQTLGDCMMALERPNQGISCYEKVLFARPDNMAAWRKWFDACKAIGREPNPDDFTPTCDSADAWSVRAGFLAASKRYLEAADASERALQIDPAHLNAEKIGIESRLFACDWRHRERDERRVFCGIREGVKMLGSTDILRICDLTDEDSLLTAQLIGASEDPLPKPLWRGEQYHHEKIRIAYISADLQDHVVADSIVGCFEHHDKTRFETTAISLSPDDGTAARPRIVQAFDRFIDAHAISDLRCASMIRDLQIDILVDLNGYTSGRRTGILARRPAPVQVNYLGYPGTMALPFMDYILADQIVVPEAQRVHYTEKVVYLPGCFFPTDDKRSIGTIPTRREEGLPETGFVFACHNEERKIGPEMFDVWMRLLRNVEGSVLALRALHPAAISNLRREAAARGVAPDRLVFTPRRRRRSAHLARLALADLFLDTLPYNAHASACDALWAGLPVLTCVGKAFHGRVAASVLQAVGLPELVTTSLADYEALALALARNPARLGAIKQKLAHNRSTEGLFDTARFTRNLEQAYIAMWQRQRAGLPPESFRVA